MDGVRWYRCLGQSTGTASRRPVSGDNVPTKRPNVEECASVASSRLSVLSESDKTPVPGRDSTQVHSRGALSLT